MFTCAYDEKTPALVSIYSGTEPVRLAWEAEGEHAARLARRAKALGGRGIYLQVMDPEVPSADAKLRKEIAERAAAQPAPFDYAMVTSSAIFRGIVTVVLWFQKQDYHVASVHGTVESAVRALEERRRTDLGFLLDMYGGIRRQVDHQRRHVS